MCDKNGRCSRFRDKVKRFFWWQSDGHGDYCHTESEDGEHSNRVVIATRRKDGDVDLLSLINCMLDIGAEAGPYSLAKCENIAQQLNVSGFLARIVVSHTQPCRDLVCKSQQAVEEAMAGEDIAASVLRHVKRTVVHHAL